MATNGDGASLGYYENVVKLNGDDGCTTLTVLKAIELYSHFKSMSFVVCALYLNKLLYLKMYILGYHNFVIFFSL